MTEYDEYAEYAASMASREGPDPLGLLPVVLDLLGDMPAGRYWMPAAGKAI
jgi:hypothetical protein